MQEIAELQKSLEEELEKGLLAEQHVQELEQEINKLEEDFEEEVKVQGITAYRYRPPKDVFDMGNPDNFCYCPGFLECACPTGNFTGNECI